MHGKLKVRNPIARSLGERRFHHRTVPSLRDELREEELDKEMKEYINGRL